MTDGEHKIQVYKGASCFWYANCSCGWIPAAVFDGGGYRRWGRPSWAGAMALAGAHRMKVTPLPEPKAGDKFYEFTDRWGDTLSAVAHGGWGEGAVLGMIKKGAPDIAIVMDGEDVSRLINSLKPYAS